MIIIMPFYAWVIWTADSIRIAVARDSEPSRLVLSFLFEDQTCFFRGQTCSFRAAKHGFPARWAIPMSDEVWSKSD